MNDGVSGAAVIGFGVLGVVCIFAIGECSDTKRRALCDENFARHAPTASDSLRYVRQGCSVPIAGEKS